MGSGTKSFLYLAACLILGNSQPIKEKLTLKEGSNVVLFRESQPIQLKCQIASSSKTVEYTWRKDGKPLDLENLKDSYQQTPDGLLTILRPKLEDEGIYQCLAKTSQGTASSGIINLQRTYIKVPTEIIKHKYTPDEGKPFKLDCPIPEGYPTPEIEWTYKQLSRRITKGPDGALYFSNVTKDDAKNSKYICDAVSPAYDQRINLQEYELEGVKETQDKNAELVPQFLSQDMTVKAGSVAMLYCIYGGTPLAYPDWFFEGRNVNGKPGDRITRHNRTGGKRLLIKTTLFSDQGTYTCEANNEVGKPQRHTIKLTVIGEPKFLKKPIDVNTPIGQDVTIDCQVEGLPSPQITWTYNAQPLKETDRISIINGPSEQTTSTAKLVIKQAQKSDIGYYGCRAMNDYGEAYAESLVVVS